MLERVWGNGNPLHCWWECKLVQSLWRIVGSFLKKLKIVLPYDLAIPPLGIYPEKAIDLKRHVHCSVDCSTVYNSQDMKANWMSISRGTDKDVTRVHHGALHSHNKEWSCIICRDEAGAKGCHIERGKTHIVY